MGMMGSCQLLLLVAVWSRPAAAGSDTGLQCPQSLDAEVNETVILPCWTTPKMDLRNKVEWVVNDTVDVYLFRNEKPELDDQGTDFKEITSLFDNELASGNCSLRLKAKMSHSEIYRCSVRVENKTKYCLISLTVRPRKGSNTTPPAPSDRIQLHNTNPPGSGTPPGGSNDSTFPPGGIVGIIIGVIIIIIFLVIWKCKRSREPIPVIDLEEGFLEEPRPPAGGVVLQHDPDDPVAQMEDGRAGDQENRAD